MSFFHFQPGHSRRGWKAVQLTVGVRCRGFITCPLYDILPSGNLVLKTVGL